MNDKDEVSWPWLRMQVLSLAGVVHIPIHMLKVNPLLFRMTVFWYGILKKIMSLKGGFRDTLIQSD